MQISYYNSLPAKGQAHTPSGTLTVNEFLDNVKFGKWRHLVEPVRAEHDKAKRDTLKRSLVSVTCSGVFSERRETGLLAHSGFICVDIDNYTDKTAILNDPYTYSCFDSVSGLGFAVLVRVNPAAHRESFRFLQKHYFESYGVVVDSAPQNVASLRYVSFDPSLQVNPRSKLSKTYAEPKRRPASIPVLITDDNVSKHVAEVVSKGANLAPTYQEYLNLSFALAAGFGEAGRQWFHALSAQDGKYDSRHADRQYDIAIKRGKTGVTVGTFYYMLKSAGISLVTEGGRAVSVAAIGKRSGRTQEAVAKQLVEINGVSQHQAEELAKEVYERQDITLKTVAGDPERLIESLVEWIQQNHPMKRNSITRTIEEGTTEVQAARLNTIYLRARAAFNSKDINFDLISRVVYSEFTPEYNPITEYIEKNRYRRSTGNIAALLSTINSDSTGGAAFMYRWLIGIIAVYHGEPVPYILALVGKGGTGKTQWFRRLLPTDLQRYYGESTLDAGKDDDLLMCQKLIIMDDELGGKSKQDEKRLKALTSKSIFNLRAPYARQNEDFKRLAILCGTANETDIVNDRTGNRRILTIEVNSINHAAYNDINKDELFMELVRLYEAGESWELTQEESQVLAEASKDYTTANKEAEAIDMFFSHPDVGGLVLEMTTTQIIAYIETNSPLRMHSIKLFGLELKKKFGNGHRREAGVYYKVVKKLIDR